MTSVKDDKEDLIQEGASAWNFCSREVRSSSVPKYNKDKWRFLGNKSGDRKSLRRNDRVKLDSWVGGGRPPKHGPPWHEHYYELKATKTHQVQDKLSTSPSPAYLYQEESY